MSAEVEGAKRRRVMRIVGGVVVVAGFSVYGMTMEETWVCLGSAYRCLASEATGATTMVQLAIAAGFILLIASLFVRAPGEGDVVREARQAFLSDRPQIIQDVRSRDGGKCRECDTPHGVDVYYVGIPGSEATVQERMAGMRDTDRMVTLCPTHTRARHYRVVDMPVR